MFNRTPKPAHVPAHRAETPSDEYEVWVSKHTSARTDVDYSSWTTETYEVPEARIYEARAIVKDEGGLITRSASARPGVVTLTVMTPPAVQAPLYGDTPETMGVFL